MDTRLPIVAVAGLCSVAALCVVCMAVEALAGREAPPSLAALAGTCIGTLNGLLIGWARDSGQAQATRPRPGKREGPP